MLPRVVRVFATRPSLRCLGSVKRFQLPLINQSFRNFCVDRKTQAHADLKQAIKELSDGETVQISHVPTSMLFEWEKKDIHDLTVEQLEELARAWFDGIDGEMEVNQQRAYEIWTEAATRGSIESKYCRAVCLRQGSGVPLSVTEAFAEMKELADKHNYGLAHYAIGIMLNSGEGVAENKEQAFHYFNKAAGAGIIPAAHNLANAYAHGIGVEKDEKIAIIYYEAGCECGDPAAKFTFGTWLYRGYGGLTVDKKRAFQLQLEAAEAGHPGAMFNTGGAYMEGEAVEQDFVQAAEWFEKAAERNIIEANVNLGNLYRVGFKGIPKDLHKALKILSRHAAYHEVSAELVKTVEEEIASST